MGLLDSVLGAIGGGNAGPGGGQGGGGQAALISLVVSLLAQQGGQSGGGLAGALGGGLGGGLGGIGGLGGLISRFQQGGLGDVVDSWIGTGQNHPVSPDQVNHVLGSDIVAQIAQHLGVSHGEAAGQLSQVLPEVVDKMTPQGEVPDASSPSGLDGIGDILARFR